MANSVRSFWAGRDLLSASNRLPDRHSGVKGSRKRSRACGSELRVCGWVGRYCRVKCSSIEILRFLPSFLVWQIIVFRSWSQLDSTVSRLRLGKITVSKYKILSRLGKSLSPDLITDWQITVPRSYHGLANRCPQILSRLGKSLSPDPITAWQITVPRSYHGLANHCLKIKQWILPRHWRVPVKAWGRFSDVLMSRSEANTLMYVRRSEANTLLYVWRSEANTLMYVWRSKANTLMYVRRSEANKLMYVWRSEANTLMYVWRSEANTLMYVWRSEANTLMYVCRSEANTLMYVWRSEVKTITYFHDGRIRIGLESYWLSLQDERKSAGTPT